MSNGYFLIWTSNRYIKHNSIVFSAQHASRQTEQEMNDKENWVPFAQLKRIIYSLLAFCCNKTSQRAKIMYRVALFGGVHFTVNLLIKNVMK